VQTPLILSTVKVRRKLDPDPEPSYLGEWRDDLAEWNILCAAVDYVANLPEDYPMPLRGREYRAFRPEAGGERPGSPATSSTGSATTPAWRPSNRVVGLYADAKVGMTSSVVPTAQPTRSG
jgi:hypothetical protein